MGVDLIKYPYEVDCRFLDDPAAPTSKVQWTVADPNAPTLPYPSAVYNVVMEPEPLRWDLPVGEVWNGYGRVAKWKKTPAGIIGQKFCGTPSDFMNGGAYLPDEPGAQYGANGWLICCGRLPVFKGGAGGGGLIVPNVVRAIRQYGYAGAGGVIRPFVLNPTTMPGGGKGGGILQFQLRPPVAPAGGGKGGGILQFQLRPPSTPSGGGKAGGILQYVLTPAAPLSGGGKGGGVLPFVLSPAAPISGGGKGGGRVPFMLSTAAGISGGGKGGGTLAHTTSGGGGVTGVTSTSNFAAPGTFTTPAGAASGNVLILSAFSPDNRGITIASPWVLEEVWGPGTNFGQLNVYTYVKSAVGGAESVSIGVSPGAGNIGVICLAVAKTAYDVQNNGGSQGTVSSTSITAGAVTPSTASDVGQGWYAIDGLRTITLPAGLTAGPTVHATSSGFSGTLALGYVLLSSSSSFNPGTATSNVADHNDSLTSACK